MFCFENKSYIEALKKEAEIIGDNLNQRIVEADSMKDIASRILEVAKNGLVYRSYIFNCNLATVIFGVSRIMTAVIKTREPAPETVSSHTNLVMSIMDEYLKDKYGYYFDKTEDGYCYWEIMEVIRRHDLPENNIGDIPDDGRFEHSTKSRLEREYQDWYSSLSGNREFEDVFESQVEKLLNEIEMKNSKTGRAIYLADKLSAIVASFCYDTKKRSPYLQAKNCISAKDAIEMKTIQKGKISRNRKFLTSELWSCDFLVVRKLWRYDDNSFFTSLLIAIRIMVHRRWFEWR